MRLDTLINSLHELLHCANLPVPSIKSLQVEDVCTSLLSLINKNDLSPYSFISPFPLTFLLSQHIATNHPSSHQQFQWLISHLTNQQSRIFPWFVVASVRAKTSAFIIHSISISSFPNISPPRKPHHYCGVFYAFPFFLTRGLKGVSWSFVFPLWTSHSTCFSLFVHRCCIFFVQF